MFRFSIRDVLWLTVVVAVALGMFFFRPRQHHWEYKISYSQGNDALNAEGDEGWELVTVETLPFQQGIAFYFKRPK